MKPTWKHRPLRKGEQLVNPIQDEFFTTEALGGIVHGLVRETIQNSLDASDPSGSSPVKVCFFFSKGNCDINSSQSAPWLDTLQTHIKARGNGLNDPPAPDDTMEFLLIEDFNTTGLEGDIEEDDVDEDDTGNHNFFYFWRNIGRSGKSENDRGRWGLGKTVFPAASRISSFFGATARKSNSDRRFLMGQSVLKIHKDDQGIRYNPYGHFGIFGTGEETDFAKPASDGSVLDSFARTFRLKRKNEPGLSIVIPYPLAEITPEAVVCSAIQQYFYAILSDKLVVEVTSNDRTWILDVANMEKELNSPDFPENGIQKESLKKLFDFTLWALTLPEGQYVALKDQNVGKAPRWNTELFDQAVCKKIRTDFMEGHRVAFHVPINVQMESKPTQNSFFRVYMEQDAGVKNAENHFIRAGITIKDVRSLNAKGIRGMVVIEDKPLRTMLGDAENPAHTEWQKDSKKFKSRKYVNGPTSLSFVQNSLREIFQFINKPPEGRDKTLLENIFYIDRPPTEPDGETETVQPETRGGAPETIEVPELPRHKRLFQLKPLQGGFQIRQNPQSEQIPSSVTVRLAYVVRRGNPFKKYHELDFDLSKKPITIASSGIALTECGLNRLAFEVRDRTFEITVRGFDLERDLKIDAKNGPVP